MKFPPDSKKVHYTSKWKPETKKDKCATIEEVALAVSFVFAIVAICAIHAIVCR